MIQPLLEEQPSRVFVPVNISLNGSTKRTTDTERGCLYWYILIGLIGTITSFWFKVQYMLNLEGNSTDLLVSDACYLLNVFTVYTIRCKHWNKNIYDHLWKSWSYQSSIGVITFWEILLILRDIILIKNNGEFNGVNAFEVGAVATILANKFVHWHMCNLIVGFDAIHRDLYKPIVRTGLPFLLGVAGVFRMCLYFFHAQYRDGIKLYTMDLDSWIMNDLFFICICLFTISYTSWKHENRLIFIKAAMEEEIDSDDEDDGGNLAGNPEEQNETDNLNSNGIAPVELQSQL